MTPTTTKKNSTLIKAQEARLARLSDPSRIMTPLRKRRIRDVKNMISEMRETVEDAKRLQKMIDHGDYDTVRIEFGGNPRQACDYLERCAESYGMDPYQLAFN